jgi:hypothetical protein
VCEENSVRIIPAALVAATAAALLALGAGPAAAEEVTPDHTVAVDGSQTLAQSWSSSLYNRDM